MAWSRYGCEHARALPAEGLRCEWACRLQLLCRCRVAEAVEGLESKVRECSAEEFGAALDRLGFGLTERQVGEVMRVVDTDGNGTIEYAE